MSYTDAILICFGVFIYIVVSGEIEWSVVSYAVYTPTLHNMRLSTAYKYVLAQFNIW